MALEGSSCTSCRVSVGDTFEATAAFRRCRGCARGLFAAGVHSFVVSEEGGVAEDVAYYRPGVMFVERADMPAALKFYLGRPELRDRVAETGQQLLKAAPQSKFLLSAVRDIVRQRTCGAACA